MRVLCKVTSRLDQANEPTSCRKIKHTKTQSRMSVRPKKQKTWSGPSKELQKVRRNIISIFFVSCEFWHSASSFQRRLSHVQQFRRIFLLYRGVLAIQRPYFIKINLFFKSWYPAPLVDRSHASSQHHHAALSLFHSSSFNHFGLCQILTPLLSHCQSIHFSSTFGETPLFSLSPFLLHFDSTSIASETQMYIQRQQSFTSSRGCDGEEDLSFTYLLSTNTPSRSSTRIFKIKFGTFVPKYVFLSCGNGGG